jgi:hypothetical protein
MPRFVILEHDHPSLHWDLMLESGEKLRTWRLIAPPEKDNPEIEAEPSFDHRLVYLDYEGPVSGNRGHVHRWDHGIYDVIQEAGGLLLLRFDGTKVQGSASLTQSGEKWFFRHSRPQGEIGDGNSRGDASEEHGPGEQLPAS